MLVYVDQTTELSGLGLLNPMISAANIAFPGAGSAGLTPAANVIKASLAPVTVKNDTPVNFANISKADVLNIVKSIPVNNAPAQPVSVITVPVKPIEPKKEPIPVVLPIAPELRSQVVITPKTVEIPVEIKNDIPIVGGSKVSLAPKDGGTSVSLSPVESKTADIKVDITPIKELIPGGQNFSAPVFNNNDMVSAPTATPASKATGSNTATYVKYGLIGLALVVGGIALVSSSKSSSLGCPTEPTKTLSGVKSVRKYGRKKGIKAKTIKVTI